MPCQSRDCRNSAQGGMDLNGKDSHSAETRVKQGDAVSEDDIKLIKKVHRILEDGKNVEIRKDPNGKPKILKVSKELA